MEICLYSHQVLQILFLFLVNPSPQSVWAKQLFISKIHFHKFQKGFSPWSLQHTHHFSLFSLYSYSFNLRKKYKTKILIYRLKTCQVMEEELGRGGDLFLSK